MPNQFQPGETWLAAGRVVTIDGWDSLQTVSARDAVTGHLLQVPIHQLTPLRDMSSSRDHLMIPQREWERCVALANALRPYSECYALPHKLLYDIAQRFAISPRQVQRLRRRFRADPKPSALVREPGGRSKGVRLLSNEVELAIQHVITKYFARRERTSQQEIVVRARSLCRRLHLRQPSRKAVLARIASRRGPKLDKKRLGMQASKQRWEARPGQLAVTRALDLVQIDHTRVDLMILSDDRTQALGRPWLTVAIDVATRVILGFYLSMDTPSSVSVSLCIEHAVLPKKENEADVGVWPMYGKPRGFLVDNGKDLKSLALKRGCELHGIELRWRPVRRPHYGAHIERLIGTLMRLVHGLPGTTFSNTKQRGDYPSEARAVMTLDELHTWLVQKICRYYHVRTHRGLGVAPLLAWESAWRDAQGALVAPPVVPNPLAFRIDFLPLAFRIVQRTGIDFSRSRYWAEGLVPLIGLQRQIIVRYDPRDLSCLWIRLEDGTILTVPAVAGRVLSGHKTLQQMDADALRLEQAMDEGLVTCDRLEDAAVKATRQQHRNGPLTNSQPSTAESGPVSPNRAQVFAEEWLP